MPTQAAGHWGAKHCLRGMLAFGTDAGILPVFKPAPPHRRATHASLADAKHLSVQCSFLSSCSSPIAIMDAFWPLTVLDWAHDRIFQTYGLAY